MASASKLVFAAADTMRDVADRVLSGEEELQLSTDWVAHLSTRFPESNWAESFTPAPFDFSQPEHEPLAFLFEFFQMVPKLKLFPGKRYKTTSDMFDLSHFRALVSLTITEVDATRIYGIQRMRAQLQTITCRQSLGSLSYFFSKCAADQVESDNPWSALLDVDCSSNSITQMGDTLGLFPLVKTLNLSDNSIEELTNDIRQMLSLIHLDLGFNHISSLSAFSAAHSQPLQRLTELVLCNNHIASLRGLESLTGLRKLDLSKNEVKETREFRFICKHSSLRQIWIVGNPVEFEKHYRAQIFAQFKAWQSICLDGNCCGIEEQMLVEHYINLSGSDEQEKTHDGDKTIYKRLTPSAPPEWEEASSCSECAVRFTWRFGDYPRHHCRNCGKSVCQEHSSNDMVLPHIRQYAGPQRVCNTCFSTLTQPVEPSQDTEFLRKHEDPLVSSENNGSKEEKLGVVDSSSGHAQADLTYEQDDQVEPMYPVDASPSRQKHERRRKSKTVDIAEHGEEPQAFKPKSRNTTPKSSPMVSRRKPRPVDITEKGEESQVFKPKSRAATPKSSPIVSRRKIKPRTTTPKSSPTGSRRKSRAVDIAEHGDEPQAFKPKSRTSTPKSSPMVPRRNASKSASQVDARNESPRRDTAQKVKEKKKRKKKKKVAAELLAEQESLRDQVNVIFENSGNHALSILNHAWDHKRDNHRYSSQSEHSDQANEEASITEENLGHNEPESQVEPSSAVAVEPASWEDDSSKSAGDEVEISGDEAQQEESQIDLDESMFQLPESAQTESTVEYIVELFDRTNQMYSRIIQIRGTSYVLIMDLLTGKTMDMVDLTCLTEIESGEYGESLRPRVKLNFVYGRKDRRIVEFLMEAEDESEELLELLEPVAEKNRANRATESVIACLKCLKCNSVFEVEQDRFYTNRNCPYCNSLQVVEFFVPAAEKSEVVKSDRNVMNAISPILSPLSNDVIARSGIDIEDDRGDSKAAEDLDTPYPQIVKEPSIDCREIDHNRNTLLELEHFDGLSTERCLGALECYVWTPHAPGTNRFVACSSRAVYVFDLPLNENIKLLAKHAYESISHVKVSLGSCRIRIGVLDTVLDIFPPNPLVAWDFITVFSGTPILSSCYLYYDSSLSEAVEKACEDVVLAVIAESIGSIGCMQDIVADIHAPSHMREQCEPKEELGLVFSAVVYVEGYASGCLLLLFTDHMYLFEFCHDFVAPKQDSKTRSKAKVDGFDLSQDAVELVTCEEITNIECLEYNPLESETITIRYWNEDAGKTHEESCWTVTLATSTRVHDFAVALNKLWNPVFGVDLDLNINESFVVVET